MVVFRNLTSSGIDPEESSPIIRVRCTRVCMSELSSATKVTLDDCCLVFVFGFVCMGLCSVCMFFFLYISHGY